MENQIERLKDIQKEVDNLLKEKGENEKLRGTKYEQKGKEDNEVIYKKIGVLNTERGTITKNILKEREINLKRSFSEITNDLNLKPLQTEEPTYVDLTTYSAKALEVVQHMYTSSKEFQGMFYNCSEKTYGTENRFLELFMQQSDYPYVLGLVLKTEKLSFHLGGYAPENLDFSESNINGDVLIQKHIISLLENSQTAAEFFYKKFWEHERNIKL